VSDALTITRAPGGELTLVFNGPLDLESAPAVWTDAVREAASPGPALVLGLTAVTVCDGTGLGLLAEVERVATVAGADVRYAGASGELTELLRMARLDPADAHADRPAPGFVSQIGGATADVLQNLVALISFIGNLAAVVPVSLATLRKPRRDEILRNCTRVGADAVPVVGFLGALIGFILAVQAARALEKVGATSLVPMVVGFATLREFGALIAAIILAGRSGSAFAAEIGTMKVTEELDAYTTFALDPMVILVFPRVVAAVLVMPLLAIFSIACGVLAGIVPLLALGYTMPDYIQAVVDSVSVMDLVQAIVKATVFGLIVSALGCFHGLQTGRGANAVGASATKAVVAGIVGVLIADSIISAIFYTLGY